MAVRITARDLRAGDVIYLGARAHVIGLRLQGALVVVGIEELGAWLTYDGTHPVALLARPGADSAERSALRRQQTRENRLDGVRNDRGIQAAAA